jgi:CHASE2 domain-containing sensor protein
VTDTTLQDYPYASPIDRKLLADLVQAIDDAGAKKIGVDVVLDRPTKIDKDRVLLDQLRDARARVVLGVIDDRTLMSEAARKFQANALALTKRAAGHLYFHGHHSPVVISDNVVRQVAETTGQLKSFAEVLTEDETSYRLSKSARISWLLTPGDNTETFLTLPAESVLVWPA